MSATDPRAPAHGPPRPHAHGRGSLSARILTALPLLMALWQWRANPDDFALLLHGAGLVALIVAGILMVLGAIWVRKIVNSIAL